MSMVLSHRTALELYRSSMMPVSGYEKVPFLSLSVPTHNDVERYRAFPFRTSHIPLHCVVPKPRNRRNIKDGHCHVFGGEMNAIRLHKSRDESSLCVVSPEVLFLEMAAQLSGIELVKLGYELCGVYSLPMSQPNYAGTPRGYSRRKALTSVARLTAHVASQNKNRSVKKARWALRYVLDGSASPRETELSMLMVLPRKLGGYGLQKPEIRHEFVTSSEVLLFLSGKSTAFDLYWPDVGLLLRYGDQTYTGNDDNQKRNCYLSSLDVVGSRVLRVTNRDIRHAESLDEVADAVARCHGRHLRNDLQYDFAARQAELRERVLSSN